jgi:hypothetical protein
LVYFGAVLIGEGRNYEREFDDRRIRERTTGGEEDGRRGGREERRTGGPGVTTVSS